MNIIDTSGQNNLHFQEDSAIESDGVIIALSIEDLDMQLIDELKSK